MQEKFSRQPESTHRILVNNEMDKAFIDKAIEVVRRHLDDPDFDQAKLLEEMYMAKSTFFRRWVLPVLSFLSN